MLCGLLLLIILIMNYIFVNLNYYLISSSNHNTFVLFKFRMYGNSFVIFSGGTFFSIETGLVLLFKRILRFMNYLVILPFSLIIDLFY
jgi:hypothetical protein